MFTTMKRRFLVSAAVAVVAAVVAPTSASAVEAVIPIGQEVFIDHVQTGEHITPNGFATTPTFYVDLWEDHNGVILDSEKWIYRSVSAGSSLVRIENADGNVCLEPDRVEYRRVVSTKTCSTTNKQQWWYLVDTDTGVRDGYTIRPYNDVSLAITPSGVPTGNDHYTVLSNVGDYLNQVFRTRMA